MKLELFEQEFSVCRLGASVTLPDGIVFLAQTDREISLVCETRFIAFDTEKREDGWRCFRVAGELDFSLIGILAHITAVLAEASISVFCTSTYDTDYIMVRTDSLERAVEALKNAGHELVHI